MVCVSACVWVDDCARLGYVNVYSVCDLNVLSLCVAFVCHKCERCSEVCVIFVMSVCGLCSDYTNGLGECEDFKNVYCRGSLFLC